MPMYIQLFIENNKWMALNTVDGSIKIEYKSWCFQAIEKISMQQSLECLWINVWIFLI